MIRKMLFVTMAGGAILLALNAPDEQTTAKRGKELFERRCSGCHGLDNSKEGPPLRGVYGRKAASVAGFGYSEALQKMDIRWDDRSLDQWLSDPDKMVPDTDMAFRLADGGERKAVVAYLKSLGNQ
jgi:cytochrome c